MTDEQAMEIASAIEKGFGQLARSLSGERNLSSAVMELAAAVGKGFEDLGNRIAGRGAIGGEENVAIPLMEAAKALERIAQALEDRP